MVASTEKPVDADDKSDIVIDIEGGGPETEAILKEAKAPPLEEIKRAANPPNKVEAHDDWAVEVPAHKPPDDLLMDGSMVGSKKGPHYAPPALVPPPDDDDGWPVAAATNAAEKALTVVDGDLKDQTVGPELVAAVGLASAKTFDDRRTPPGGMAMPIGHELSLPEGEPVFQEGPADRPLGLPPPPAIRSAGIIEDQAMLEKDENDLKTENVGVHAVVLPGAVIINDADLMRGRERDIDRQMSKVRAMRERANRLADLEERRLTVLKKRRVPFNALHRLHEEVEKARAGRRPIDERFDEKNRALEAVKAELTDLAKLMKHHEAEAKLAKEMLDKNVIDNADVL
jgi:hypothetical protein